MFASVYAEYVEHPSIPGGRAYVSMPEGGRMGLTADGGWRHDFRNRKECVRWLAKTMPDALCYAFDDGLTLCAGSVAGLAKRLGA